MRKIGPILEENAEENDKLGRLNEATFAALKPLRMSHIFAGEEIGGAQLSPTHGLELIEAITYHSGGAGWISMVHACIGAMSAAFLPDTRDRPPLCAGHGEPLLRTRHADRHAEEGRRRLSAERQVVLCERHLPRHLHPHRGASRRRRRAAGQGRERRRDRACAPTPRSSSIDLLGNWDVLGLHATGSIDYGAKDVFIPDDMVFPILTAQPQRLKEFFSLGVVGLAAIGHSGWAIGASRRILDEVAKFARTKTGRSGLLGESDKFWFDFGRAEARVRAARAFLFEVWRDVEASIEGGNRVSTRQISLVHLAKSEVHEAGVDACQFVYRAAGGASLRRGIMQRVYREMLTASNHFTINPNIVGAAGRDIGGVWSDRTWQFYDLIEKK